MSASKLEFVQRLDINLYALGFREGDGELSYGHNVAKRRLHDHPFTTT